jgi:hypothetical protein
MRVTPLVLLALLVSAPAYSASVVYGPGAISCGKWTDDRHNNPFAAGDDVSWVLGYVSAYNVWGKQDIPEGTDAAGMAAWIDNYCARNPLDSLAVAAEAMISAMLDVKVQAILKHPPSK